MTARSFLCVLAVALTVCGGCAHDSSRPDAAPSAAAASRGARVFATHCEVCHGSDGGGGQLGPPLHLENRKKDLAATIDFVKDPPPVMPKLYPAQISARDVSDVAAYVQTL